MGSKVQGSRFHSHPWAAFRSGIYEKSGNFVRPNSYFGAKLAIIWKNEHLERGLWVFNVLFVLNPEPLNREPFNPSQES